MKARYGVSTEELPADRTRLLTLTAPEMTVLIGGRRMLGANGGQTPRGVFTHRPKVLTGDFVVNPLDRAPSGAPAGYGTVYDGRGRATGAPKWAGTRVGLVFGSNFQLRALAEV